MRHDLEGLIQEEFGDGIMSAIDVPISEPGRPMPH
jgi:cyanate lyase